MRVTNESTTNILTEGISNTPNARLGRQHRTLSIVTMISKIRITMIGKIRITYNKHNTLNI